MEEVYMKETYKETYKMIYITDKINGYQKRLIIKQKKIKSKSGFQQENLFIIFFIYCC